MRPFDPRKRTAAQKREMLEKEHWLELRGLMRKRDWFVQKIHAAEELSGWPDVYASHKEFGPRWIETKRPETGRLTDEQRRVFTELHAHGTGIWILETIEDYPLLFQPPNWW